MRSEAAVWQDPYVAFNRLGRIATPQPPPAQDRNILRFTFDASNQSSHSVNSKRSQTGGRRTRGIKKEEEDDDDDEEED